MPPGADARGGNSFEFVMRRLHLTFADMALCLLIAAGVYFGATKLMSTPARFSTTSSDSRWGEGYMPNLPVVDQYGNTHLFYDDLIKGKKVIINFMYASCSQICGLVTSRLVLLQDKLGDAVGRDYQMYSITVDPFNDGPAELKRHADAFKVRPGWLFLTGNPDDIQLIRDKLGERSKVLADHRQEILLGDDPIGAWSKNSVFGDLDSLALTVLAMHPELDRRDLLQRAVVSDTQNLELLPGQALFGRLCSSCHTIGEGVRVGPDLDGVVAKRDRQWLTNFISAPDRLFAAKDPLAMEIGAAFPNVTMPNLALSKRDAEDVIAYLERRASTQQ